MGSCLDVDDACELGNLPQGRGLHVEPRKLSRTIREVLEA